MKSSFLSKYEQKIVKISALTTQGRILKKFRSYFGRNDDFINSFWNCLTLVLPLSIPSRVILVVLDPTNVVAVVASSRDFFNILHFFLVHEKEVI